MRDELGFVPGKRAAAPARDAVHGIAHTERQHLVFLQARGKKRLPEVTGLLVGKSRQQVDVEGRARQGTPEL